MMRTNLKKAVTTAAALLLFLASGAAQSNYTQFVNPFIGAADNGHTFPGACVPFGLIQTSPVTGAVGWNYCSEYIYKDTRIWGFSQTHLNGTGCMDLGDILVMPVTARTNRADYRSAFNKSSEHARPGYYEVMLDETGVKAELTATAHVALHRYTYQKTDSAGLFIDLQHGPAWNDKQYHSHVLACEVNWENDHTLSGHLCNQVWVKKDVFFVITFNRPMTGLRNLPLQDTEKGNRMLISFPVKQGETLEVKVALSSASIEGAKKNLSTELPGWDFEHTAAEADRQWNQYLSRIDIEGTADQKTNFYTSMYHTMIQPNNIADVDGMYRDAKGNLACAEGGDEFYSTFSFWDTFRAAHPFYTLIVPDKVDAFIRSAVAQADVQGFLPIWALWGKENYCMVANHSVSVVAEAYHKGFRGFNAERAFEAVKRTQTVSHPQKSDWETYMKYGYLPCDLIKSESVSSSLESMYDDYAAADMAKLMGKKEDAAYFGRRANFYKNLFDPTTKLMRPRNSDGSWKTPFDPSNLTHAESNGGDYTEGNAWQYTWQVQHDIPGLIKMMGGKEYFLTKLDSLFSMKLNSNLADVTGLIGQYAHGNEPSHHVIYLYTLAGRPERAQELVRQIFDTQYLPKPDGLCGNDDCGQMSAWYIFSAMGFYPVNPVSGQYVFGAPQMPRFVLHLQNGKTFTIVAENLSKEHKYIDKIFLNGKLYKKNYIDHADILKGGTLVYKMK